MLPIFLGGDYKRSGYVQYLPVILADVPARTTFIEIYNYVLDVHICLHGLIALICYFR